MNGASKIGADALISALAPAGAGVLFHLPGVETLPVIERMGRDCAIRPIMVAHEQAAAFGAFGYGRVSGRPGVCLTVPGPGATNLVTGIAAAKADQVPLVAITTMLPDRLVGTGAAHDCDLAALFAPIVKAQMRVGSADEIGVAAHAALALSLEPPRGPVQLMVTGAMLAAPLSVALPRLVRQPRPTLSPEAGEALVTLAQRLDAARRPVLYAGRPVIDAEAVGEFTRLAEKLDALIVTDESARGIVDERHPRCLGTASHRGIVAGLAEGDITVAIGARFSQWSTRDWTLPFPEPITRIDAWDAPQSPKYRIKQQILGDVKLCLAFLLERIAEKSSLPGLGRSAPPHDALVQGPPFHPAHVLDAIRAAMPEDAIAVVDGSSTGTWAAEQIFPIYRPHGFITPEVLKELGSAVMVGIGAGLAAADRPVVVIQGDGGFLFQAGELSTIVREQIPLTIIIFNDGYYNADRLLLEHMFGGNPKGCALHNPDFVALAAAFGIFAQRVETLVELKQAVSDSTRAGRPTVIDVPIDPAPVPYRLQLVFDALKRP